MPSAQRRIRLTTLGRLTVASAICLLIVSTATVVGRTHPAKGDVEEARRSKAQNERPARAPAHPENEAATPLEITEASVEISAPYETGLKGLRGDKEVTLIDKGEKARRFKLTLKMVNKSDHTIVKFIVRLFNPGFLSDDSILVGSDYSLSHSGPPININPQETFTFTTDLPLADKRNGQELGNHLSGFRVKMAEVTINRGGYQEWVEGGIFGNLLGRAEDMVTVIDCEGGKVFRLVKTRPADEPPTGHTSDGLADKLADRLAAKGILVPTEACWSQIVYKHIDTSETGRLSPDGLQASGGTDLEAPIIFYSQRANYTEEARWHKVEGIVVLAVVFNVSGRITDIRTIAGLPCTLTETAIEAARKIRFQPAVKNGAPVSVRRLLIFSFTLN